MRVNHWLKVVGIYWGLRAFPYESCYLDQFRLGFINFNLVSELRKGHRSWGRALTQNSKSKQIWGKNITFAPIIALATLKAASMQLNGILMMGKIQHSMQDDAIRAARIHPAIRVEVLIRQNLQLTYWDPVLEKPKSQEPSQPILSYEPIENFLRI